MHILFFTKATLLAIAPIAVAMMAIVAAATAVCKMSVHFRK